LAIRNASTTPWQYPRGVILITSKALFGVYAVGIDGMIRFGMAVAATAGNVITGRAAQARAAQWTRFRALLLDLVVFAIVTVVVDVVYGVNTLPWPWLIPPWMAYYIVPEGLYGASLGKMLLGLCVVRVDGRPLRLGSIWTRNLLRFIDVLPLFYLLGGLSVRLTTYSQRVGDRWAGTTVVFRDHAAEPGETRHPPRSANRLLLATLLIATLFTIAFEYFGRPALVLEGLYSEHQLMAPGLTSYQLGSPQWSLGRVTYPLTGYEGTKMCTGFISLNWSWPFGWSQSDGTLDCV
jgi:uncharacterized RDD family membrane protein YckC